MVCTTLFHGQQRRCLASRAAQQKRVAQEAPSPGGTIYAEPTASRKHPNSWFHVSTAKAGGCFPTTFNILYALLDKCGTRKVVALPSEPSKTRMLHTGSSLEETALTTSCPTKPPTTAHTGEISASRHAHTVLHMPEQRGANRCECHHVMWRCAVV